MKKKVGILGGAFDPITKGHIQIAHFVLDNTDIDEIWVVPCYSHIFDKKMASPEDRLKMCEVAVKDEPNIKVSDLDIQYQATCTVVFVNNLLKGHPWLPDKYEFSYIIGMDNANTFDKWIEADKLKTMIRFIVVPRQGIKEDSNVQWYKKKPHIYLKADKPIDKTSSTQIRELIQEGEFGNVFNLLNHDVYKYAVMKENLYK